MSVRIEHFTEKYLKQIYEIGYKKEMPEWAKFNGPYFEEYESFDSYEEFKQSSDYMYLSTDNARCIVYDDNAVGMLSRNWNSIKTRWLEIGIVIYDESLWGKNIGVKAIELWVSEIFDQYKELEHIGLTTWSGNPRMEGLARKAGFLKEAQIRKVRYWQGTYYDSVKYGLLREDWEIHNQESQADINEKDIAIEDNKNWFRYRVGAIIIEDGSVAFAHNSINSYYYSIGGAVKMGESAEDAVKREVFEELGVNYEIDRLAVIHENIFIGDEIPLTGLQCHEIALYYLMKPRGSKEVLAQSTNMYGAKEKIEWLPIIQLDQINAYPKFMKNYLENPKDEIIHISTIDGLDQDK